MNNFDSDLRAFMRGRKNGGKGEATILKAEIILLQQIEK